MGELTDAATQALWDITDLPNQPLDCYEPTELDDPSTVCIYGIRGAYYVNDQGEQIGVWSKLQDARDYDQFNYLGQIRKT